MFQSIKGQLLFVSCFLASLLPPAALSQTPLGIELQLNGQYDTATDLDLAASPSGTFTAVWSQAPDPTQGLQEVVARTFGPTRRSSAETKLITASIPYHVILFPTLSPTTSGGWALFYSQSRPDGYRQLFGSLFSPSGASLGARFRVSDPARSLADVRAVASLSTGGYFVLAEDDLCPGCQFPLHHLFARTLDASGEPTSPYFQVDTNPLRTAFSGVKSLSADASGTTVVVWEGEPQRFDPTQTAILIQRFSSTGQRFGGSFLVTKPSSAKVLAPSIAVNPAGDFIVVWQYQLDPNTPRSLHARHFSKDAKPLGQEFVVEADSVADAIVPSIASDSRGNYAVAWTSYGSPYCPSVKGRLYRPDDTPVGPAFYLSSGTNTCDQFPKVAFGPNRTFAAAWIRTLDDGGSDIYAAMFQVNP
jgi:hypothetical protein